MSKLTRWQVYFKVGLVIVVLAAFSVYYKRVIRNPEAELVSKQLQAEFDSIPSFPDASSDHHQVSYKDTQALVISNYHAHSDFSEVRGHYDTELAKRGWHFVSEEKLTNWGRDLGESVVHYSRDDWFASLELVKQDSQDGVTYGFSLSWGIPGNNR
jgi:hypothetical protein